ncbi:YiiX/YebB-like N1pC/P60 family cysteine hydrolase [Fusobacterium varium]|uniref:YiiX/YebB-like N1pC/P60 family cysteine hydrolase n=1 Tax=Fusobacterium varium TaxID=856 RepID=UPI0030CF519A
MKKYTVLAILLIFFIGCTNNSKISFYDYRDVIYNGKELEIGDILVKEKGKNFLSWWGHSSIVVSENMIGDFPKLGEKYYETDIQSWTKDKRKVAILRYKNINDDFKNKLMKNLEKYKNSPYSIILSKENEEEFYCSKFIWLIYKKTFEELGIEIDIDGNGGWLVFPYDFFESRELTKVKLHKLKRER